MEPNLEGFKEAQKRLVEKLGEAVVLLTPVPASYPDGTKLDPETGNPLDPWVRPLNSGYASATIKASVVWTPGVKALDDESPLGIKSEKPAAFRVNEEDYTRLGGSGATRAVYADRFFRIEDRLLDPLPRQRMIHVEPL